MTIIKKETLELLSIGDLLAAKADQMVKDHKVPEAYISIMVKYLHAYKSGVTFSEVDRHIISNILSDSEEQQGS